MNNSHACSPKATAEAPRRSPRLFVVARSMTRAGELAAEVGSPTYFTPVTPRSSHEILRGMTIAPTDTVLVADEGGDTDRVWHRLTMCVIGETYDEFVTCECTPADRLATYEEARNELQLSTVYESELRR